jgi:hypothetical protein
MGTEWLAGQGSTNYAMQKTAEASGASLDKGAARLKWLGSESGFAFLTCLGLSNLWFLAAWRELESKTYTYFRRPPMDLPYALQYLAALLLDVALLALIFWALYIWISRSSIPHAETIILGLFLCSLIVSLNAIRTEAGLFRINSLAGWTVLGLLAIVTVNWRRNLFRPAAIGVMFTVPLLAVKIISSASHVMTASAYTEPALANRLTATPPRRLVWIVFDEFDQQLAFARRPDGFRLPNLDGFKAESFAASNVHRVARDTVVAIPSLLLGQLVNTAEPVRENGLSLTLPDGTRRQYPAEGNVRNNIFAVARQRGFNAAVSGWYHPYCRTFSESLTDCVWAPAFGAPTFFDPLLSKPDSGSSVWTLLDKMALVSRRALARLPAVAQPANTPLSTYERSAHQISEFETIYQAALRFCADPQLGLVFLHFPLPHGYGIYNSRTGHIEPGGTYLDNLQLTDKTFAGLRSAMEGAHIWDSTTVLVTSDHSLRADYWISTPPFLEPGTQESPQVPFLLKLYGQHVGINYDAPFSAILTRDLVLSILSGEFSSPEQLTRWLDRNRLRVPVAN